MARVAGYSEDDLAAIEVDFELVLRQSYDRVCAKVAAQLRPAIVASHVFHLPGKHDQKTHGRSRQRDPKVLDDYGDWGGKWKAPWMASSDPDVRASQLWADTWEGQQAIVTTMRGIHAGKADPTEDVDFKGEVLKGHAKVFSYDTDEKYGTDAVRDDVFNAAMHLDGRLEAAPVISTPLYRGMRVKNPEGKLRTGDTFDSDVSSWTTKERTASFYTRTHEGSQAPSDGVPVLMRISGGSRGVNLDNGSLGRTAGSGEHLLRGTFKITGTSYEGDTYVVDVEQLWLPA